MMVFPRPQLSDAAQGSLAQNIALELFHLELLTLAQMPRNPS
jgi:hypothetical protein